MTWVSCLKDVKKESREVMSAKKQVIYNRLYNTAEVRNAEIPQKPLDIKQQLTGRQLSFSRSP